MAFSGKTDFTYTRDQLITAALRKCRAFEEEGGSPEAHQFDGAAEALNIILKEFQTKGTLLWVQQDIEIPLAKNKAAYTIGPNGDVKATRPLRFHDSRIRDLRDPDKIDVPINRYSKSDYDMLTNKFEQGRPVAAYYSRQIDKGILYVWPVPDISKYKIIGTIDIPIQDFTASGDTAHMPAYAYRYFLWALAAELAPEYGLDLKEIAYFEAKANKLEDNLLDFEEEEDGFQMVPDRTSYQI